MSLFAYIGTPKSEWFLPRNNSRVNPEATPAKATALIDKTVVRRFLKAKKVDLHINVISHLKLLHPIC
jgi:hypothetical protein